jgi:hypothetical protein
MPKVTPPSSESLDAFVKMMEMASKDAQGVKRKEEFFYWIMVANRLVVIVTCIAILFVIFNI